MALSELAYRQRLHLGGLVYELTVQTHFWVACVVTSMALFGYRQLDFDVDWTALGIVFCSTLLIYNVDTALDLRRPTEAVLPGSSDADDIPTSSRQQAATRRALVAFLLLVVLLTRCSWQTAVLVVAGAGACCLYAVPLGARRWQLKALPGAKSVFVGCAIAVAVISVPLVENGARFTREAWFVMATLALVIAACATLFDVRDLEQDRARGLRTLPVLLGLRATRVLLCVTLVASLSTISLLEPGIGPTAWLCLAALLPLTLTLSPSSPRGAYAWLVDGSLLLPWLLTLR